MEEKDFTGIRGLNTSARPGELSGERSPEVKIERRRRR